MIESVIKTPETVCENMPTRIHLCNEIYIWLSAADNTMSDEECDWNKSQNELVKILETLSRLDASLRFSIASDKSPGSCTIQERGK
jgi:hypothetical protein